MYACLYNSDAVIRSILYAALWGNRSTSMMELKLAKAHSDRAEYQNLARRYVGELGRLDYSMPWLMQQWKAKQGL